ncbi:MAG: hypothetical protein K6T92_01035 [Candidatus Rokubacteria bacterium]|nr:hypothetical protein [Candidatus Rokubacteria bacterium]
MPGDLARARGALARRTGELRENLRSLARDLRDWEASDALALVAGDGRPVPSDLLEEALSAGDAIAAADLLLDLAYLDVPAVVAGFRRSALVDIDPGLTQIWLAGGQMRLPPHDIYFTIGETVGRAGALVPDCGIRWHYTPPPVFLPAWPVTPAPSGAAYTTVSNWWGGEWVTWQGTTYHNDKGVSFLGFLDLPRRVPVPVELALCLGAGDGEDRRRLQERGFRVRDAREVSATPAQYRAYIQQSRGEWSCAKPSCMRLQNAWVSDRTLCYLASGKPAVVQHTGPSRILPDAEGLFRFRTLEDAVRALAAAEADYERHCRLARALAEAHFDGVRVLARVLERALA